MEKILSIVIPTYNMEDLLSKCLSSLIVKNHLDMLEVLVVNDGSKDLSSEIAHQFEKENPDTFRVIDKENGNYGSCVNRGLKEAKGKYIKILDADDSFDKDVLDSYLEYCHNVDADLIITDWCLVDSTGKCTYTYHYPFDLQKEYSLKDMNLSMDFRMHGLTYKTECLRKIGYSQMEGISYTDSEWCFMPMSVVKSVRYYEKVLYQYLVGREGQTVEDSVHAKKYWMEVNVLERMINQYIENKDRWADDVCNYMLNSLIGRIKIVYEKVLIEYYGCYPMDKFRKLDQFIKKSIPECVERTNDFIIYKRLPIKYVKAWRKGGFMEFQLNFLRLYYRLKKAI